MEIQTQQRFVQLNGPTGALYISANDIVAISDAKIYSSGPGQVRSEVWIRGMEDPFNVFQPSHEVRDLVSKAMESKGK